jgi:hypothetical protein
VLPFLSLLQDGHSHWVRRTLTVLLGSAQAELLQALQPVLAPVFPKPPQVAMPADSAQEVIPCNNIITLHTLHTLTITSSIGLAKCTVGVGYKDDGQ